MFELKQYASLMDASEFEDDMVDLWLVVLRLLLLLADKMLVVVAFETG